MFVIMSRCPHDPLMSQQGNTDEGIDCESVCGKTPVIILTCKKSAKHFKTRKNLLLYEVILPFYSRQQYVQIRVTIYSDWIFQFRSLFLIQ